MMNSREERRNIIHMRAATTNAETQNSQLALFACCKLPSTSCKQAASQQQENDVQLNRQKAQQFQNGSIRRS